MYIRRKVFSRFEDENGNERLFSTTEYTYEDNCDQRTYAEKDSKKKDKKDADPEKKNSLGRKIAVASGIAAGAALTTAGGYQLVKHGQYRNKLKNEYGANPKEMTKEALKAAYGKMREENSNKLDKFGQKTGDRAIKAVGKGAKWVGNKASKLADRVKNGKYTHPGWDSDDPE